jgi:RHS repeat-associated protein
VSARRILAATALCLLALPAWAQMQPNSIANEPPEVDLVYPTPGQQLVIGSSMAMGATAFDADDGVQRVDFLVDGSTVATDLTDGYTGIWTVTAGSHTVAARATDNRSKSTTTSAITIITVPNAPPSVALTAPTAGSSWTVGAALPMTATANDNDGSIDRVEFWVDNVKKGQDTSSPYAYSGWVVTAGDHAIKVKALDDLGAVTSTSAINIHGNYLPTVSLTAPASGASVAVNTSITMSATASDSDGSINRVEFWVDGAKVDQDASSPYSRNWTAATPGNHTIQGRAFDNRGAMTATMAITITVVNTPPTISLASPTAGSTWTVGDPLQMTATASDSDGSIDHVEFWIDNVKKAEDTSSPYAYSGWTVTAGDHAIKVKAVDDLGAITATSAINIHGNYLPTVALTSPANGASYEVGDSVPMSATASDSDGSINRVEFWVDGAKVDQDASSPYSRNWSAAGVGDHTIQAQAFDNRGAMTATTAVTVHVAAPANTAPNVDLSTPGNRTTFAFGETVPLTAIAHDADGDGTIDRIEIWEGSNKLGQGTGSTYSLDWDGVASGPHTLQARAYDDDQAMGTDSVTITVSEAGNAVPTVDLTTPGNQTTYAFGESVPLSATAHDADGDATIDRIEIWDGSNKLGQGAGSTYSLDWDGAASGSHDLQARVYDDEQAMGTDSITITVNAPANVPPTVNLTSPADGATYTSGDAVTLTASANDNDGTIARVDYYVDGILTASATTSPYAQSWTAAAGSHVLRAVAVDDGGASSSPSDATVTVSLPPPPTSITRTYTYNSYQELCRVEEPETGVTLMGYDDAGNLTWSASGLPAGTACSSNGNGVDRKVTRTYDARNRITNLEFPDLNGNQAWTYTPDGLPSSVTTWNDAGASSVINTYAYNHRRLLTGESQQSDAATRSVGYGYDANGHLSTLVYPADGLTVAYAPNALGEPTQAGSYATDVTYFPNGAIQHFIYGNGIVHTLTQNVRGLPDRSRDLNDSTPVHDDSYDYDSVGNVVAISDAVSGNRGDRYMEYDDLNRLVLAKGSPSAPSLMFGTATYTYDAYDNLTHVHVTGGSQVRDQEYGYDERNRLTNLSDGTGTVVGLGYDVQGNLANKNGVLYGFDYGNRLRTAGPESYRYDVQGRRIRSASSAGTIDSLYSQSGQLLFQDDGRSGKHRQYVYLGGSLVAESDVPQAGGSATVIYQHTDALGTPVAITNASKTVTERREYEPYGYQLTPTLQDGPNYTGHVADAATGLINMQQRFFDPLVGQHFLSVDPVTAYSPGGAFNQYWYANANPYRFTDPDGRDPQTMDDSHRPIPPPTGPFPCTEDCNPPPPPPPPPPPCSEACMRLRYTSAHGGSRAQATSVVQGYGWFRPANHGPVVGRPGTIVPPGHGIGLFIDDHVPAGHTFGANHDVFVGWAVSRGCPDLLCNIPSMGPLYAISAGEEAINMQVDLFNHMWGTDVPIPFIHKDPED